MAIRTKEDETGERVPVLRKEKRKMGFRRDVGGFLHAKVGQFWFGSEKGRTKQLGIRQKSQRFNLSRLKSHRKTEEYVKMKKIL